MRIILATHNPDKVKEFREIITDSRINWVTMGELGFRDEIAESGHSYAENAKIKAEAVFQALGGPVLADDSGLSVDALDGYPGIYSARFAGVNTDYVDKIHALQALLANVPEADRTASFHCAICYITAAGELRIYEKKVDGVILHERRGTNGFGYDPVFYLPELAKTTAELKPEEKHALSHRGLALRAWYQDVFRDGEQGGGDDE